MRRFARAMCCAIALGLAGCPGQGAKEMLDTAQFEELQDNREHASELYEEIVRKYPDSEEAKTARARLSDLKKGND